MMLGVDASSSKIGIAIIDKDSQIILSDAIKFDTNSSLYQRAEFFKEYCSKIKEKYEVKYVIIEEPFISILKENNIKNTEDARKCEELWDTNNGVVLCIECHKKTDNYGAKAK